MLKKIDYKYWNNCFLCNPIPIYVIIVITFVLSPIANSQGISESAAVNSGAASAGAGLNRNNNTVKNLSKFYSDPFSSGANKNTGNANSANNRRKKRASPEEAKAAAEESNKLYRLAQQKENAGKLDEAKQLYYKSATSRSHIWGDSDPAVVKIALKIAEIELKQKHPDQAIIYYKRSVAILSKRFSSGAEELIPVLSQLAKLEASQNKHDEASSYYEHLLLLEERKYGENNQNCAATRINLIEEYLASNDINDADKLVKKAIDIETKERGIASQDYSKLQQLSTQIAATRASNSSK